jgi:hypothetical protein
MKIVITGGGGFIGFKLAKALLARGTLASDKIARLTLVDQAFPAGLPEDPRLETLAGDISDPKFAARAIAPDTGSVFHMAAVVSGAAEADFDLGMRVNLQGMRNVLEQARMRKKVVSAREAENHPVARMLPRVITHTENEVFHSLQKGMFPFNLIGLVIEPHVFHRSTLLSCGCLHDQVSNGLASGISRVAQRCSYEGRGRTVGKVDSVHVDGKYIERTLVEGAIGVVECAECSCHSVAIKVSHRFVEKGLSFCGVGARGQARTIHREHEDSCGGAAKHCSESHGRLLLGCKAEAKLEQSVARRTMTFAAGASGSLRARKSVAVVRRRTPGSW